MDVMWIIFLIVGFLFLIASGVSVGIWTYRLKWNYTWVLIRDGQIVQRGRCRMLPFGDGGEEIFFLNKVKKWRVAYGKRIGKNQIAWVEGKDGYWYNVSLGDLDKKLMELGVHPVDRDMRYSYASARKGIENRYNEKNFFDKYGTAITIGMLILAILAFGATCYFIFKQQVAITASNLEAMKIAERVLATSERVLANVDNVNGGAGLVAI